MYRSIYITAASDEEAERIAKGLLEDRIAACVNWSPIRSMYWWKGTMESAEEVVMFVKTRAELVDRVVEKVRELHSYECPCVVSFVLDKGNEDYFQWIDAETRT